MSSDIQREADELARYWGELGRRVADAGVRDVGDLLALHDQLRRALAAVSVQEIEWAADRARQLIATLSGLEQSLATIAGLKATLGAPAHREAPAGATAPVWDAATPSDGPVAFDGTPSANGTGD
jgi:hypothetical protein